MELSNIDWTSFVKGLSTGLGAWVIWTVVKDGWTTIDTSDAFDVFGDDDYDDRYDDDYDYLSREIRRPSEDGYPCDRCKSDNTIETGPPDQHREVQVLCAACGHVTNVFVDRDKYEQIDGPSIERDRERIALIKNGLGHTLKPTFPSRNYGA